VRPYQSAGRALGLARQAIALDSTLPEAFVARGYIANLALAPPAVIRPDFERAMALRPTSTDLSTWNALLLQREGHTAAALAEARRAITVDPLSPARRIGYALAALSARRYDEALREARQAAALEPELRRPRQIEAVALLLQGQAAACAELEFWPFEGIRAACLRAAGRGPLAAVLIDSLERTVRRPAGSGGGGGEGSGGGGGGGGGAFSDLLPAQELAYFYAWIGDADSALRYLALAFERSPAGVDPRLVESGLFDPVLGVPAFTGQLTRLRDAAWPEVQRHARGPETLAQLASARDRRS
jgi:tetratricopeptide (TPR) repeat protein